MPRKRETVLYQSTDDLIEAAFKKGSRKVNADFEGCVAVAFLGFAVVPKGAKLDTAVAQGLLDGHYVELAKCCRADLDELDAGLKVAKKKADKAFDIAEEYELQWPA